MSYMTRLPGVPDSDDVKEGMAYFANTARTARRARRARTAATGARSKSKSTRDRPRWRKSRFVTAAAECFIDFPASMGRASIRNGTRASTTRRGVNGNTRKCSRQYRIHIAKFNRGEHNDRTDLDLNSKSQPGFRTHPGRHNRRTGHEDQARQHGARQPLQALIEGRKRGFNARIHRQGRQIRRPQDARISPDLTARRQGTQKAGEIHAFVAAGDLRGEATASIRTITRRKRLAPGRRVARRLSRCDVPGRTRIERGGRSRTAVRGRTRT